MDSDVKLGDRYTVVDTFEDGSLVRTTALDGIADDRKVSILSLTDNALQNPNVLDWFKKGSNHLSTFNHNNIVTFIDSAGPGVLFSSPAIVTESLETNLHEYLNQNDLKPSSVRFITEELLSGLGAIHDREILHLDIHPKTIGISADGRTIKFMDLGNCTVASHGNVSLEPNTKYCAPENYNSEQSLGRYSDLYSIGMIAYEALLGNRLFEEQFSSVMSEPNEPDRVRKWVNWHVSTEEVTPPHEVESSISREFSNKVVNLLHKDIEKRSASVEAVGAHSDSGDATVNNGKTGEFPDEPNAWKKLMIWTGAAVGVVLVSVVGFIVLRSFGSAPSQPVVQVDTDEINRLVGVSSRQQEVIKKLELPSTPLYEGGKRELDLATDAYNTEDFGEMLVRMKSGVAILDDHINIEGQSLLEERIQVLGELNESATALGTVSLEAIPDSVLVPDFDDLEKLEQKSSQLTGFITQYEEGISKNNREVTIGSSQEQIDGAVEACRRYVQGCTVDWYADELERMVELSPFELDEKEVILAEFAKYVENYSVVTEAERRGFSAKVVPSAGFAVAKVEGINWENAYDNGSQNLPVVHVTRADASGYCESVDKRLPTEGEWEFSARGYLLSTYPWGMDWDKNRLYWGETEADTLLPVGSFQPSESGFYDLAGSVSEWTSTNSEKSGHAILKGASRFDTNVANIRLAVRRSEPLDYSGDDVGFRCAKDLDTWPNTTKE